MPTLKKPAADLRSRYPRYLKISLIFSLSFFVKAFNLSPNASKPKLMIEPTEPPIIVTEIPETVQKPKPPPPLEDPQLIEPTDNELDEPEFKETEWYETDKITEPPPPLSRPEIPKETEIFVWSEVMPKPVGGLA